MMPLSTASNLRKLFRRGWLKLGRARVLLKGARMLRGAGSGRLPHPGRRVLADLYEEHRTCLDSHVHEHTLGNRRISVYKNTHSLNCAPRCIV